MHTWAKRGLQTALVTGGLFMLGTGIASAQDHVNPDTRPVGIDSLATLSPQNASAAPQDASTAPLVDAPIQANNNTANSPVGNVDLPSTSGRAQVLPGAPDKVNALTQALAGTSTVAEVGAPVQAVNNQVGIGSPANASGNFGQQYSAPTPVTTDGAGQTLAGNVVRSQNLTPVQLANNAVAVASNASTSGTATQAATGGGDITTSGAGGTVAGTIADQRSAAPVGVGGTALAVGGTSHSSSCTGQDVTNSGKNTTSGVAGTLAGTAANLPLALPAVVNTNGASVLGRATAAHTAGDAVTGPDGSTANAVAAGDVFDRAPNSVLSGTILSGPLSTPTGVYGNAVNGGGTTVAQHSGSVLAIAGASTYGDGSDSIGSGTTAATPVAAVVDVVCAAGSALGSGTAGCAEDRTVTAGFYNGSLGNGATAGGNVVQTPLVAPVEGLSNAAGAGGDATSDLSETKQINAGWSPNSNDDDGKLSSNVVQAANALAAEVNTVGVGVLGNAHPTSAITVTGKAGQPAQASGTGGTGSGNVVNESAAYYAVVEEVLGAAGGRAEGFADNSYHLVAQGPVNTTGEDGIISGNIVPASLAGGSRVGGVSAAAVGRAQGALHSVACTVAGGQNKTNGDDGTLSGNILADLPLAAPVDVVGHAVSVAGQAGQSADTVSGLSSGGDGLTSGRRGTLSGDIVSAPVAPAVDWFGDAANLLGRAHATAVDITPAEIGGDHTTDGTDGALSGDILNPGLGLLTGVETDAIGTGPALASGVGGFSGQITGTNATAGSGTLDGTNLLSPLPVHAALQQLEIPLGAPVKAFLIKAPQDWVDPGALEVPIDLGTAGGVAGPADLPMAGDLADAGGLGDLLSLGDLGNLLSLGDVSNLGSLTSLSGLLGGGLPL